MTTSRAFAVACTIALAFSLVGGSVDVEFWQPDEPITICPRAHAVIAARLAYGSRANAGAQASNGRYYLNARELQQLVSLDNAGSEPRAPRCNNR